jgi:drug/metabolite transporter (DMT)-like permease
MSEVEESKPRSLEVPRVARRTLVSWFIDPYVQIGVGSLLTCAAELLLKKGAVSAPQLSWLPDWFGASALGSSWTWLGILAYIGSFASWLRVLRLVPLNIAYSLVNVAQVLVPIGAAVLLHERITPWRWAGIALVLAGVSSVMSAAAELERRK